MRRLKFVQGAAPQGMPFFSFFLSLFFFSFLAVRDGCIEGEALAEKSDVFLRFMIFFLIIFKRHL